MKNIYLKILAILCGILGLINVAIKDNNKDVVMILWSIVFFNSVDKYIEKKDKSWLVVGVFSIIVFILMFVKKIYIY